MNFASDNSAGVPQVILDALTTVNGGFAGSYGNDPAMQAVRDKIREIFDAPEAETYLVATGTAANALSLACLCPPWGSIYCQRHAHIEEDECGAPEFFTSGAKLTLIDGPDAKMTPEALAQAIANTGLIGVHNVQKGALSISNVTELGAVYTVEEVRALTQIAKSSAIPCHMDGARFANALVATRATAAEMSWQSGIDILSFGGAKNGMFGVEAVVIFDPKLAWEFELRRKRGGHLQSKHRFLSAQMQAYLTDDRWIQWAGHANQMAQGLAAGLNKNPDVSFKHPVDANMIFAEWTRRIHKKLHAAGASYYITPEAPLEGDDDEVLGARLVTSWASTPDDISRFLRAFD